MANTPNSIITPQLAILGTANLAAVGACTTRGPTATAGLAAANIFLLVPANASADIPINMISVKAISTAIAAPTVPQLIGIWHWDGTTAYLIDEIAVTLVTPSTTTASFKLDTVYTYLKLPMTHALYASTTIATTAATTALQVKAYGSSL
jgi:hypothetical protein